jgi:hypothetical protein
MSLLNIDGGADIRTDSKASISFTGLMAQNYVAITFRLPRRAQAEDGAVLNDHRAARPGRTFRQAGLRGHRRAKPHPQFQRREN